ncbi:hypothetical protein TSUD_34040 [Trifolium subterraneum]|uniref:Uncharacterized protein n=1 Tax=Trifolium subterraneum TaxID=3900 RepID=A0A2Z6LV93_TRISU|nr:hypothetical protein TSUD_34040 [Trifolium subterraneum]
MTRGRWGFIDHNLKWVEVVIVVENESVKGEIEFIEAVIVVENELVKGEIELIEAMIVVEVGVE